MRINAILLATVFVVVSYVVANDNPFASKSSLQYRTWKRSVKTCGDDGHCFLPWKRSPRPFFPEFFVDYKKDRRDGFLVPCPSLYTMSTPVGLDPFRMCYPGPELEPMLGAVPNNCSQTQASYFGFDSLPISCLPKDPCFIDRRFALRVVNASMSNVVTGTPNATFVTTDSIALFGYSVQFTLFSSTARDGKMCAMVDGFQQFEATVMFHAEQKAVNASIAPIQVTETDTEDHGLSYNRLKWVERPIKYNVSITTTCTKSGDDCDFHRSFSNVHHAVVARELPFAEFNKEVTMSRPNDACVPFRTTFGIRGLFCVEYDGQPTLFGVTKPPTKITAEEFEAIQAQQSVQQRNIELFLW